MADFRAPMSLRAPAETFETSCDLLVIGSGVAGLSLALAAAGEAGAGEPVRRVTLVSKGALISGSTPWAQGGVAAAMAPDDSPEQHLADTLAAGGGLCDPRAAALIAQEGPRAIAALLAFKVNFDRDSDGALQLGREGGHRANRIVHAGGDATGAEVSRALAQAVKAHPAITVLERTRALDLLLDDGRCGGALVCAGNDPRAIGLVRAGAVVLCTGGMSQIYAASSNPPGSSGDGLAMALRAGALGRDLEFVQFHPTVMWTGLHARGQAPLISEAVRGEGAVLVDGDGRRFMMGEHELVDLAPRDVVAKAIFRRMAASGAPHVWLDARAFGDGMWRARFPSIHRACLAHGVDPARELIPVMPAAHYACGGVRVDLDGRTSVPGLYACGETACTGVHGANRLASNSLLEAVVFARRIADDVRVRQRQAPARASRPSGPGGAINPAAGDEVRAMMSRWAGVARSGETLEAAARALAATGRSTGAVGLDAWEATDMLTAACGLVAAALVREETRGCHWRSDFPETDDMRWHAHIDVRMAHGGVIEAVRADVGGGAFAWPAA